jgi:uncharacterized membrane protein YkvA (DUF1232 family)
MLRLLKLLRFVAKDLRLLLFALRHTRRPFWLAPTVIVLGLYALDPVNFAIPFVGAVDDFVLIPLVLHFLLRLLPGEIRAGYALD